MDLSKIQVASVTFALCCLLSSARLVIEAPTLGKLSNSANEIPKRSDQRFAELKEMLPKRGVVGYIGESGAPAVGGYYLAQYALSPLVLDHSPNHPLVVGNFPTQPPPPSQDLQLVKDFGNGVLLFSRKDGQ